MRSGRRRYPAATPGPPITSSPGTPIGDGWSKRSSTRHVLFGIGAPIGTLGPSNPSGTRKAWLHTVPSVGPYSLTSVAPGQRERCAATRAEGQASPATITQRSDPRRPEDVSSSRSE